MNEHLKRIESWYARIAEGDVAGVRDELEAVPAADRPVDIAWIELCEIAGALELADRGYRELRDASPDDEDLAWKHARVMEARGDRAGAADALQRLRGTRRGLTDQADGPVAAQRHAAEGLPWADVGDGDLLRFLELFRGREDVHARQWFDRSRGTGYTPVHRPLDVGLIKQHLLGIMTLGVYPIRRDGTSGFFAIDLDLGLDAIAEAATDPDRMAGLRQDLAHATEHWHDALTSCGFAPLLEDSGRRGRHLWVFFEQAVDARDLDRLGKSLVARTQDGQPTAVKVEVFPRQARVRKEGLGNLIKLPLGVHLASGRRSCLLEPGSFQPAPEPLALLRTVPKALPQSVAAQVASSSDVMSTTPRDAAAAPAATDGAAHTQPPAPAIPWTEGHLRTSGSVVRLLQGCSVLAEIVRQALDGQTPSHDAQVVLRHTLGHLDEGAAAVNYVLRRGNVTEQSSYMRSPLRGPPMSCARMGRRLGLSVDHACICPSAVTDTYVHPLLHLRSESRPEPVSAAHRCAEAFRALALDPNAREDERVGLQKTLISILESDPERCIAIDQGLFRLVDEDGLVALRFEEVDQRSNREDACEADVADAGDPSERHTTDLESGPDPDNGGGR